ncbi:hypothetical protein RGJ21_003558 [Serratia marcescens]
MASRRKSELEQMVIEVLKRSKEPLSLLKITEKIIEVAPSLLRGATPSNSLYSIIYKREKRREADGDTAVFLRLNKGRLVYYTLADKKK